MLRESSLQARLQKPMHRARRVLWIGALGGGIVLLGFAGCLSDGNAQPAVLGPSRPLQVRHTDGTTEMVVVADQTGLIVGMVRDAAALPLPGVLVTLGDTSRQEKTTASGHFLFDNLAPGTYELQAVSDGYRPAESKLRIRSGEVARVLVTMIATEGAAVTEGSGDSDVAPFALSSNRNVAIPAVEVPTWSLVALAVIIALITIVVVRRLRDPARVVARGRSALTRGLTAKAEGLALKALKRNPGNSDAWILLGTSLIKRRAYADAIRVLEHASSYYDPQVAGVAFLITLAYRRMGRPDAARPWLQLVARNEAYWGALNQDPEGALANWLNKGKMRTPNDPAYA